MQVVFWEIEVPIMVSISQRAAQIGMMLTVAAGVGAASPRPADAQGVASPWVQGYNNRARLLAGRVAATGTTSLYAGVEIEMPQGWKTYWRFPGDAGGVPPSFEWEGSGNLSSARVLFPAPHRMLDKSGATAGYKDHVVLPIEITPKDAGKPVALSLKVEYGVCKDICVPAEALLELEIAPEVSASPGIDTALALVPLRTARPGVDPVLAKWSLHSAGQKPALRLEVADPGGGGGDAFVDAPDGSYLPLPRKISDKDGEAVYEVDLSDGVDIKALGGKDITVTLVGAKGQTETVIKLNPA